MKSAWQQRASVVADVARGLAASAPPARGLPFFGLDHPSGTPLALLDALAARGIFRKYEHVLDLGGGLGASARYLAARLGCTATATARSPAEAAAAASLTARAGLDWQVLHLAADATRLPFATAAFTHVWIVESLPGLGPVARVLGEAARVLRPGGHLGVQELVVVEPADELAADGHVEADAREAAIDHAGFVEIVRRDVGLEAPAPDARVRTAWARVAQRLGDGDPLVRRRRTLAAALEAGRLRLVQLTARRP